ncbi:MAG: Glycogen synthase [Chlamydiae bacterium]|nr:Glycogen synthase [Chlamydiota bacterium]
MHIVHVASELAPIAKVGGLADVILGLSHELAWEGHDLDVIIPKYDIIDIESITDLHVDEPELVFEYDGKEISNTIWLGWVENLKVYFIETHHPKLFFNRGCIYGCEDDIERYLYFSKAALELMKARGMEPHILHLHDWHTGMMAPLYQDVYHELGANGLKIAYTIHNLAYQGKCLDLDLDKLGVKGKDYASEDKLSVPGDPTHLNLMKAGIAYADAVTTVSKTYAKEIQTEEEGKGLGDFLKQHSDKIYGIVNGLDYAFWNPETDPYLHAHYSSREKPQDDNDHSTIDRKAFVKNSFREELMLDERHRPLVGCVARLVPQKGVELMRHALFRTLELGGQFVLLGTTTIPRINREFHELMHHFADHPHVRLILKHNEETAHRIFAASDMFIVPSIFEPCGLTQLISMKYGTVPIVRRTGGLSDTVVDVDTSDLPFEERNGYLFDDPTPESFNTALDRAFKCWFDEPMRWREIMINGMNMDFSWKRPVKEYLDLYEKIRS